ncbi:S4 domain-containing protein, partial [Anoxybacillus geothermalis]|nr:S4 domain-containing protein [Anoxybacillus geothermalis]
TDDRDVIRYLKYFTFLLKAEIGAHEQELREAPEKQAAQRALAEEGTRLGHGEEALRQAIRISEALFSGDIASLTAAEIEQGFKDVPSYVHEGGDVPLVELLVAANISPSKRQAREDIQNGAIYVNGERIQDAGAVLTAEHRLEGRFTVIRRGKKKYHLIRYA